MRTSVVLSTYNGEKYILEQLESIHIQNVAIDEVLIFDDCSTDKTAEICQEFINNNKLTSWKLIKNEVNKGFVRNFTDGLYQTNGDIIFLCDQDDIWCKNKVSRTLEVFKQNNILSLTSTFLRFNEKGICCQHVKHPYRKPNDLKKISLHEYCLFNGFLGMATAINRDLINRYNFQELYYHFDSHDIMINYAAVIANGLFHLDEALVYRRNYMGSTSNKNKNNDLVKLNNNRLLSAAISVSDSYKSYLQVKIGNDRQTAFIERMLCLNNLRLRYLPNYSIVKYVLLIRLLFSPIYLRYLKDGTVLLKQLFLLIKCKL